MAIVAETVVDHCRAVAALVRRPEASLSSIKSVAALRGFSRLLLHLRIFENPATIALFDKFVSDTSVVEGGFVLFNFVCPLVYPAGEKISLSRQVLSAIERLSSILQNGKRRSDPDARNRFAQEMKRVILRHKKSRRISDLSTKIGQFRKGYTSVISYNY